MPQKPGRRHDIDNLRWICIMILVPFHTAMAWNCWGESNYIWFFDNRIASTFIVLISPWFMPLMFVLAGISARYALRRRTFGAFVKERFMKLFLPLIAGLLTVVPFITYLADRFHNGYTSGFLEHYAIFFTKVTTFTGYDGGFTPAHLWFLLFLYVISMMSLGVIALQRRFAPSFDLAGAGWAWILLPVLVLPFANLILSVGGKGLVYYFILFLLGYYLLSEDRVLEKITQRKGILAGVAASFILLGAILFIWVDGVPALVWQIPLHIACWFGILAILGFGSTFLNFDNRVTRYLSSRSFLFYILHFGFLLATQYVVAQYTKDATILVIASIGGGYLLTFLGCEVLLLVLRLSQRLLRGKSTGKN